MKIGKALLLLLGIMLIALGTKAVFGVSDVGDALSGAVVLESAVVLPENEGKIVVFYGEPQMAAPVYDEELGLTLDTVKALRYSETYKQTGKSDGETKWGWVAEGSKTLVGEANVGEFELSEEILLTFSADHEYTEFDETQISGYSLDSPIGSSLTYVLPKGAYYYSEEHVNYDQSRVERDVNREYARRGEGTKAYRYRTFDMEKSGEMTFVGRQQGNKLAHSGVDGVTHVYAGVKLQEELVKGNETTLYLSAGLAILAGLGLVLLAMRGGRGHQDEKRKKG